MVGGRNLRTVKLSKKLLEFHIENTTDFMSLANRQNSKWEKIVNGRKKVNVNFSLFSKYMWMYKYSGIKRYDMVNGFLQ